MPAPQPTHASSSAKNPMPPQPEGQPKTPTVTVVSKDCPENSYFNGNECVCEVGYVFMEGECKVPNIAVSIPVIVTYPGPKRGCKNNMNQGGNADNTNQQ